MSAGAGRATGPAGATVSTADTPSAATSDAEPGAATTTTGPGPASSGAGLASTGSASDGEPSATDGLTAPAGGEPDPAVDPLVALQAVDWPNESYAVVCPGPERTEVQLTAGEFRPERGNFRGLGAVLYGEIDDRGNGGRRTVAAIGIRCIGASHFPSTWLLYGAEPDGTVLDLGMVAGGAMDVGNVEPPYWWEADLGVFVDGLLHLRGRGYSPGAAHCCPDYEVFGAFALGPDGPFEVAHHEIRDLTVPTLPRFPPAPGG